MVHEWNGHLEILSPSQAIENSRPCLLLGKIFYRKQLLDAPDIKTVFYLSGLLQPAIWYQNNHFQ